MNHPHSYAHINELGYQAVRRAILPSYPRPRSGDGRFLNRIETKARDLRAELQCQSNQTLSEAIEDIRGRVG